MWRTMNLARTHRVHALGTLSMQPGGRGSNAPITVVPTS
jgi:hypothetical protein